VTARHARPRPWRRWLTVIIVAAALMAAAVITLGALCAAG
jgi:hypothetical protein